MAKIETMVSSRRRRNVEGREKMGKSGEAEKNRKRKAPGPVATEDAPPPLLAASKLNPSLHYRRLKTRVSRKSQSDSASVSPEEEDSDQSRELHQDDIIHDSSDEEEEDDDLESLALSSSEDDSENDRPLSRPRESIVKKWLDGHGVQDTGGTQESVVEDENTERMESTVPPGMSLQSCIQKKYLQPEKHFRIELPSIMSASKSSDCSRGEATPIKGHPPVPAKLHANTSSQPATSTLLVPSAPEKHFRIIEMLPSIFLTSESSVAGHGEATPLKGHPPVPARLHANTSSQPATSSLVLPPVPLVFDRLKPFLCEDKPKVSRVTDNVVPPEPRAESSFPRFSHAKLMAMFWEVKDMLLTVKELENTELVKELDERITKLLFSVPGDVLTLKQRAVLEELFKELYSLFDDIAGVNFQESTLQRCQEEEITATKGKVELTTSVKGLSDKYDHLDVEIKELEARLRNLKKEKEQVVQEAETLEPKLKETDWILRSATARVKDATEERDRCREAKVLALSRLEEFGRRL